MGQATADAATALPATLFVGPRRFYDLVQAGARRSATRLLRGPSGESRPSRTCRIALALWVDRRTTVLDPFVGGVVAAVGLIGRALRAIVRAPQDIERHNAQALREYEDMHRWMQDQARKLEAALRASVNELAARGILDSGERVYQESRDSNGVRSMAPRPQVAA